MYVAEHDIDTASARKKHYERPQNKLRGLTKRIARAHSKQES